MRIVILLILCLCFVSYPSFGQDPVRIGIACAIRGIDLMVEKPYDSVDLSALLKL